ncbi:unnamed protein product [Mycena citricolor]|uniref:Uncharacterized protein n=1 Tax=Mycena citricolor TaxID=2018698 RepID=A0AAD2HH23_9AGAR|nr:unnamed protein product [Mycena citricolor]
MSSLPGSADVPMNNTGPTGRRLNEMACSHFRSQFVCALIVLLIAGSDGQPGPLGEVPSLGVHLGFNARPLTFFKLQVRFGVFQTSALGIVSHGISPRSILAPLQPSHTILSVSFPFVWSGQDAFRVSKAPASSKHAPLNMSSRTTLPRLKNVHSTDYIQIA